MNPTFVPGGVIRFGSAGAGGIVANTRTPAGMMARITAARTGAYGLAVAQEGPSFFGLGTTTRGVPQNGMFYNRATMEAVGRGATARGLRMQEYLRGQEEDAAQRRREGAENARRQLLDAWEGPLGDQWKRMIDRGQIREAMNLFDRVQRLLDAFGGAAA